MKKHNVLIVLLCGISICFGGLYVWRSLQEKKILKEIISRLHADSRIAHVIVTNSVYNPVTKKTRTTIKFLEYTTNNTPLEPRYFTFPDNIIQFQSLVIRFHDTFIEKADALRGKSVYVFWKVFSLNGRETVEYPITHAYAIPGGYAVRGSKNTFEQTLWAHFWDYALTAQKAKKAGIKNAQIEAPGTRFIPGFIYTIKIEHSGGLRIDAAPIPKILDA